MRNILYFFLGILLSFFISVPFAFASDVGPFTGAPVSDRINYTSSPGTTYTKMVEQATGPISSDSSSYGIPNQARTTLGNGITIDAKLVTEIPKAGIKAAIWNAITKGRANPWVIGCMTLCPALIDEGWKWMNDAQQWVKSSGDPLFNNSSNVYIKQAFCGLSTGQNVTYGQMMSYCNSTTYAKYNNRTTSEIGTYSIGGTNYPLFRMNLSGVINGINYSGVVEFALKTGQANYNQSAVTESDINSAVDNYMANETPENIIATTAELDFVKFDSDGIPIYESIPFLGVPQHVTSLTPQAETPEKTISKTTSNNQDGTVTTKEVKQKEVVKTDTTTNNSTVNNTTINYTITKITNTYTNSNTTPDSSTEEPVDDGGSVTPPDGPTFEELTVPKDFSDLPSGVSSFLNSIPSIPTSFSCADPIFPFMTISFTLPLCEWIEHFRALFVWFWNILTAIAIYIMVRSMNVATGAVGGK